MAKLAMMLLLICRIAADYMHTNDALYRQQEKERRKREKQEDDVDDYERQRKHQDAEWVVDLVA